MDSVLLLQSRRLRWITAVIQWLGLVAVLINSPASSRLWAQRSNSNSTKALACVVREDVSGFIDLDGNWVFRSGPNAEIVTRYDFSTQFSGGMAPVAQFSLAPVTGKWGFIDATGKVVIKPRFDFVGAFNDGLAPFKLNNKWGYIDKTGKEVISAQYDYAYPFSEGLALVEQRGKKGYISKNGTLMIPFQVWNDAHSFKQGRAMVMRDNLRGYLDKSGALIIQLHPYEDARDFNNGRACVKKNGKFGLIDINGRVVVPFNFYFLEDFSEGLAMNLVDIRFGTELAGFIDIYGKEVIKPSFVYSQAAPTFRFSEGFAAVPKGRKYGYIDKQGRWVIKAQFDEAHPFVMGRALVRINNKFGYIDKSGTLVIPPIFDLAYSFAKVEG